MTGRRHPRRNRASSTTRSDGCAFWAGSKKLERPAIPTTLTGKKLEVPVRKILLGTSPEQAANTSAMADPSSLDAFLDYARTQHDYQT